MNAQTILVLLVSGATLANGFVAPRTGEFGLSALKAANTATAGEKKTFLKKERDTIAKKKDFLRGAGVFKDVKAQVTEDMKKQFDSDLMVQMKESPNYMMEKDGIEFYLAKEYGFCWGGEKNKLCKILFRINWAQQRLGLLGPNSIELNQLA